MTRYAIPVRKEHLDLITLLNQGVTPIIEGVPTYFVVDGSPTSDVPTELMTEEVLLAKEEIAFSLMIFELK